MKLDSFHPTVVCPSSENATDEQSVDVVVVDTMLLLLSSTERLTLATGPFVFTGLSKASSLPSEPAQSSLSEEDVETSSRGSSSSCFSREVGPETAQFR